MASVSKRAHTRADGSNGDKWIVRYVDGAGTHRQKSFDRKKEADAYRLKVDSEKATHGTVFGATAMTVAKLFDDYAKHTDRRLADGQIKRGSHRNIVDGIRVSVIPKLGKVKLTDIDAPMLERWFMDIREQDGISARTAVHRLSKLSGMLDFAVRRGLMRANPAGAARTQIGGIPTIPIRQFTVEQVQALLAAAKVRRLNQHAQTQKMTEVIVNLAAFCGMRLGEILALEIDHINLADQTIRVEKSLDQWDQSVAPKTRYSFRLLRMPAPVAELLSEWIKTGYRENPRRLLFRRHIPGRGVIDGPVSGRHFGLLYFWRLCDSIGLGPDKQGRRFHFHALRHFAGSWWLKKGLPVTTVSRLMGHASPAVTMSIYAHDLMTADAQHTAIEEMATALIAQGLRTAELA